MARVFKLKGIKPLMEAAAIVRDRVPNVLFRVLGEVADRDYFASCQRAIAGNDLENNIEFGVTKENYKAYCEADVYCLPSLSEGAPYAVIEAMMSGCPVVATEVGNVKQILGPTGLLVRPNDPGELASALLEVLDGPGAASFRDYLAEAALRRAREHFTLERCTGAFRQLYHEVRHAETVASITESYR
jgi:glycosyltransferase involved in cell wall biosynthesis